MIPGFFKLFFPPSLLLSSHSLSSQWFFSAIVNVSDQVVVLTLKIQLLSARPLTISWLSLRLKKLPTYYVNYLSFYSVCEIVFLTRTSSVIKEFKRFLRGPTTDPPLHWVSHVSYDLMRWAHLLPLQTIGEGKQIKLFGSQYIEGNPVVRILELGTIARKTQRLCGTGIKIPEKADFWPVWLG